MIKKLVYLFLLSVFVPLSVVWAFDENPDEVNANYVDSIVFSTISPHQNFRDDQIIVTLRFDYSQYLGEFTPGDFQEIEIYKVECISPGIDIKRKLLLNPYYDNHNLNLEAFRRRFILTLLEPSRDNVLSGISLLEQRSDMRSATPVLIHEESLPPLSNNFSLRHHPNQNPYWWIGRIRLPGAHEITKGCDSFVVGVIDMGINRHHPQLGNRVCQFLSATFNTNQTSPFTEMQGSHGTAVAGMLASNNFGVAPNVRIASLQVHGSNRDLYVMRAINYSITQPEIRLLNLSSYAHLYCIKVLDSIRAFNGLVVASTGNYYCRDTIVNIDQRYPNLKISGSHRPPNLLVVGASDIDENNRNIRAWISKVGSQSVDLFAPGYRMRSILSNEFVISGTSFATPLVTGTAALMLSVNPHLSPLQLRRVINESVNLVVEPCISNMYSITGGLLCVLSALRNIPITVSPEQWGFRPQYYFHSVLSSHNFNNLTINSRRRRTGFIENEFIVLSSNREGAGLAYWELHFSRPLRNLEIDLALWSNNEGLGVPISEISIQYRVYGQSWRTAINLHLLPLPLRANPRRVMLIFENNVFDIRIRNRHHHPTGDRNLGRICVGLLTLQTRSDW